MLLFRRTAALMGLLLFLCHPSFAQSRRHQNAAPGQTDGGLRLADASTPAYSAVGSPSGTYDVGPVVEPTTTTYEAEESIAVHQLNPTFLVAAISDFSIDRYGFVGNTTKYAWSHDGGSTWAESFVELDQTVNRNPLTGNGRTWMRNSDPVVAIDSVRNIAYMSNLYFNTTTGGSYWYSLDSGVYVSAGPIVSGNVNFTAARTQPVFVNTTGNYSIFEDKEWIAVDNSLNKSTSGNVYVAWTHYYDSSNYWGGEIWVARSNNQAATFKTPVAVSPSSQLNFVQGAQVAVDTVGRVLVAWEHCLATDSYLNCVNSELWGAVSTNGGLTFSPPVPLTGSRNDLEASGFPSYFRKNSMPSMAVDPVTGYVAFVYADQPGLSSAVEYVVCPPAFSGACTPPRVVNDSTEGQRVFPAVAIDYLGIVHVSWFDGRNAPANPYSSQLDLYATFAPSVKKPFRANVRVTPSSTDFSTIGLWPSSYFIGDYTGIAAAWGYAHPAFTNGHLQTTTTLIAKP